MARRDDLPLFGPEELLSDESLAQDREAALEPGAGKPNPDLDAARLWRSREDGLLVRGVKPHSAEKSLAVTRSLDTVTSAMAGKWFVVKHGLEYIELYSGPGRLVDESNGHEQLGSPVQALNLRKPFTRYVFGDFSQDCVDALAVRVGDRPDVNVLRGNANDPTHLDKVARLLNPKALVIAYLDPARPRDLHWETVRYLAEKFGFIDLLINLPVNSLMRAILGHYRGGGSGPGAAGRLLNHPNPRELLRPERDNHQLTATIQAIRDYYTSQLVDLGFLAPSRRTICFPPTNPYYDILYVSRHKIGIELWDKTNPEPEDPQLSLLS